MACIEGSYSWLLLVLCIMEECTTESLKNNVFLTGQIMGKTKHKKSTIWKYGVEMMACLKPQDLNGL